MKKRMFGPYLMDIVGQRMIRFYTDNDVSSPIVTWHGLQSRMK